MRFFVRVAACAFSADMLRAAALVCAVLFLSSEGRAQIGGRFAGQVLELPVGAKQAALGTYNITSPSQDVQMVFANPALLSEEMVGNASFNFGKYLGDIRQNTLGYAFNTPKYGRWALGVSYLNYGDFTETDASGNQTGKFSASDYVIQATHARTTGAFTMGGTLKFNGSSLAEQKASALAVDLGTVFKHPEQDFQIGLAIKNVGFQLKSFGDKKEPIPFDAQLGMSYKLEHMPLRFSVTAHHLNKFDIVYLDTAQSKTQNADGQAEAEKKSTADKIARHFVFGGEFLLSKNLHFRVGYNHLRRRELRLEDRSGGAGFSLGGAIQVKAFQFAFTKAFYHVAGSTTYITVAADMGRLFVKKEAEGAN